MPSDLRCNSSASAGWRSRRFPRRVCKLAISDDPRTYERPSHFFTASLVDFFRRIVKAGISSHIVKPAMLSMAVFPAFNLNFFCSRKSSVNRGMDVIYVHVKKNYILATSFRAMHGGKF